MPGAAVSSPADVLNERESSIERTRLFDGVMATLESLATRAPLLLVLEDVHWAGSDMMSLLEYVARRAARSKISIVASYRDGDIPRSHPLRAMRRRLQEESLIANLSLGPLQVRDVQRYLELAQRGASADVAERLCAASGGLPLILIELAASSDLERPTGVPALAEVPALAARLESIPTETRVLLEIAAVVGLGFDLELIAEVSGWSESETNRHLSVALGRRMVREATSGTYGFAHDLFREIVYDAIPPATRARRHALVARALEELHPNAADQLSSELAMHFERAGEIGRAVDALEAAALRARSVFAHEDAATFATRALHLGASGDLETRLLLIREEANRFAGKRDLQRIDLERCEAIAGEDADPGVLCDILLRRFNLEGATSQRDAQRDVLERFEKAAARASSPWPGWAALSRARLALAKGRTAHARAALQKAEAVFESSTDSRGIFETALELVSCERHGGDVRAMATHFSRAEAHLSKLDDAGDRIVALYEQRALVADHHQRYAEARLWASRFLEAAMETRDVGRIARAHRLLGGAAAWLHEMVPAYEHLDKAQHLFESLGDRIEAYSVMSYRGLLETRIGLPESARASFETARAIARAFGYDAGDAACALNLSHVHNQCRRFVDARALANESLELATEIGYDALRAPALVNLGVALRHLGDTAAAVAALDEACAAADAGGRQELAAESWSELALTLAVLGRVPTAVSAADRARALLAELPVVTRPVGRLLTVSEAYNVVGKVELARAMRREAIGLVQQQLSALPDPASRDVFARIEENADLLRSAPADDLRTAPIYSHSYELSHTPSENV